MVLFHQKCWRLSLRTKLKLLRLPLKSESFQLLKDKFGSQQQGQNKRSAEIALEALRMTPTKWPKLHASIDNQPEEDP
ncbi:hypothetical protein E2C01_087179 [Portunus trituberculatus]|uniref:Uncharacterized protein n=1 Tax=Portunus trituberculatus TaxID=210409 RepID=A0A5B7JFH2_PORTR|nr:hypothetical protein [Portunus trituberculatus]